MPRTPFDVVFIDFFGTIADGDRHEVERVCGLIVRDARLDVEPSQLATMWAKHFFETIDRSNNSQFRTLFDCEIVSLLQLLGALEVKLDPLPYIRQIQSYWKNPPLHGEAKEALSKLPVPVCCLSNADQQDLETAIESHGLRFEQIVSSERARSYKPDPDIFRYALKLMNTTPDRVVHVGDSLYSDVWGAQREGIKAVWIERDHRIADIGTARPDLTIKSLVDLAGLFQ